MAIGLILLTQTTLICLFSGTIYSSFWFSYILFIINICGIILLFIYITWYDSNEIFSPSNNIISITVAIYLRISLIMFNPTNNNEISVFNNNIEN